MKRILLLFSALMLSCIALWAHDVKIEGIYYSIYYNLDETNKTAEVTYRGNAYDDYDGEYSGSVTIPETITYNSKIYSVTSIGHQAFYGCYGLTSVTIPNSVTSIGKSAFYGCYGLTSVTIPNSVTSIDDEAFSDCSGLTSVTIPNSVTSIGYATFYYCYRLTSITIGKSVTSIGSYAFYKCTGLTSVTIPNSVTSIGDNAFAECSRLTSVTIGKSVTSIDNKAFYNTGIYNNKSNWDNGVLYIDNCLIEANGGVVEGSYTIKKGTRIIGHRAFSGCRRLTSVTIPNSVTSIGRYAFDNCNGLTSVTIGESVTSIGSYAFENCSGLTSVTIPNSVTSIGSGAFYKCTGLTSVIWNAKNCKDFSSYKYSPFENISFTSFTFGNEVEHIPAYLCYGQGILTEITIPNSVTSIGQYAFSFCIRLTSVTIPNSVTSISQYAFKSCRGLTSVTIPNSVTSIGQYAFDDCFRLTSITIPNSVTSIGQYAFSGCSGLTSVTIPNSVTSIGQYAFSGCSRLTSVIWNAKNCADFNSSEYSPFDDISSYITSFTFGNEVEHIPAHLCYGMSKLSEVTIPNSVTSIGSSAFSGCSGLTKVNYLGTVDKWVEIDFDDFDSNPTYYAKDLYLNNELLADAKITTADSIKNYAFYNCQSIKSVEIGESVTSIGSSAFSGCDKLRKVTAYPTTVPNVYESSFAHYNAYLYVPCDVYDDYFLDDVFGTFKVKECIAAEEVDAPDKVEIEVDEDNNAIVIWPSTDGAKKYELEISKDGEVFCTLLFNENGQLTSIDFGYRSASIGFQFTVTGLDSASKYAYSMVAMDKKGNELQSYKGTFTTNGYVPGPGEEDEPTSITETLADANITVSGGTISAEADFSIYNTIGQDVTAFNGSLQLGIYLVSIENNIVKVMVH